MKSTVITLQDEQGNILGYTTNPSAGIEISTDDPKYIKYLEDLNKTNEENRIKSSWDWLRQQRNNLLKESDWSAFPDVVLKNKEAWLTYRQALRDLPSKFSKPEEVIWPEPPNK